VQEYRDERGNGEDVEVRAEISRAVDASPTLRNKMDLIENFVDSVSVDGEIDEEGRVFIAARREAELDAIIEGEGLRPDAARAFVEAAFRDGSLRTPLAPKTRFSNCQPIHPRATVVPHPGRRRLR
jgi:type I restriction enzyme R subunit